MRLELERKHYLILASCVLIMVLGITTFYFLFYQPQELRVGQLQQEIVIEQRLIQALEEQSQLQASTGGNTVELQRKIPVTPFVEQLILELDKAEVLSDSRIINMTFGDETFTPATSTLDDYENGNSDETEENVEEVTYLPEGLKKITVNLSVESETYEDLTSFLSSLENLTRVTQIESVTFTGQPEITSTEQELDTLTYSVTMSAFYYPELEDLLEDLPPLSVPAPSNRTNPFIDTN
ncbi:pilus assembly protein PilO [Sutcliffiella rhizosphaerae]|uniref:Pilus assembly protein PilO n=1 Tax=Sutcliffiella rhizosphaerae TaxID=2880967 RepID=A0ABM8YIE6_9BACI|nr:pilus assembly protein PilO [Sutcliffiella rhizosphaerae]CAG9619505.1 hypothetical protein BACCIP111883_00272 [Sutcliffiella rhizosphaerae]